MNKPVEVELRSLKQNASLDEHVFSYARTGLKLITFRHAWEGACTAAKISGLRFHDLRHTFATRLRAKGVHEMDIMSLLGHTTLQMTSRYTHAMPENLRTAVDSLNEHPLPFRPRPAATGIAPRRANSLLERMEGPFISRGKLLKRNGGGDRTRTCISLRTAVFKTAALPLCDPSAELLCETIAQVNRCPQPAEVE
jgi:hypothetical protein